MSTATAEMEFETMDATVAAVVIGGVTLAFNVALRVFGGSWNLSGQIKSVQDGLAGLQLEVRKLSAVLIEMSNMRGDLKVMDERFTAQDRRLNSIETDIRELKHGEGFVRGLRGVDREYP